MTVINFELQAALFRLFLADVYKNNTLTSIRIILINMEQQNAA